ncbi:unnamed protein product [Calypogeia fissa]
MSNADKQKRKLQALSVVRREEENEAIYEMKEAHKGKPGENTVATSNALRAWGDAAENAHNLAAVGANYGYKPAQEEKNPMAHVFN